MCEALISTTSTAKRTNKQKKQNKVYKSFLPQVWTHTQEVRSRPAKAADQTLFQQKQSKKVKLGHLGSIEGNIYTSHYLDSIYLVYFLSSICIKVKILL
jgi:hypothetical protein